METTAGSEAPRRGQRRWVCALNYALFRITRAVLVRLPHRAVWGFADALAALGWAIVPRYRRATLENLALALPEASESDRRAIGQACFRSFSRSIFDVIAWSRRTPEQVRERLIVEGWEHFEAAEAEGKGVILMTAHLGNWELAGQIFPIEGRRVGFMARPIPDQRLERELAAIRERFGGEGLPKRGSVRKLLSMLRAKGSIFMMIDQRVHPNEGKAYRFFGLPAYTSPVPANLSLRTGAPVVPFYGIPSEDGRKLRVVIRAPIRPDDPPRAGTEHLEAADRLTLRYMEELEEIIREYPGLWLWMHRRWRKNPTLTTVRHLPPNTAPTDADVCIERAHHA